MAEQPGGGNAVAETWWRTPVAEACWLTLGEQLFPYVKAFFIRFQNCDLSILKNTEILIGILLILPDNNSAHPKSN